MECCVVPRCYDIVLDWGHGPCCWGPTQCLGALFSLYALARCLMLESAYLIPFADNRNSPWGPHHCIQCTQSSLAADLSPVTHLQAHSPHMTGWALIACDQNQRKTAQWFDLEPENAEGPSAHVAVLCAFLICIACIDLRGCVSYQLLT
jgi:hypothetical protein